MMLFVTSTLSFFILTTGSERAAYAILGQGATDASVAAFNHEHGIDRPVLVQYWDWITHAVRLDFGQPWTFTQPVTELIAGRLATSFEIVGLAMVLAAVFSVALGVLAAVRGGWIDRVAQFVSLLGFGLPNYLIALALVLLFAVKYQVFSATGWVMPGDSFLQFLKVAALPVIAIAYGATAALTMQVRGAVKDALEFDYVRVLTTRGLSFRRIVLKHVLRNAGGPALTVFGMQFVGMLGGVVVIEQIFAIPGFGQFSRSATSVTDIPALMGLITTTAILVVIVNLLIDILSAMLNPKVRLS